MKLVAINFIDRGRLMEPSRIEPGSIFDATPSEVDVLLAMRAAREATEHDLALADARAAQVDAPVQIADQPEPTDRELLEAKAKALGVDFRANISDEKLAERINAAETTVDSAGKGADTQAGGAGNDESLV